MQQTFRGMEAALGASHVLPAWALLVTVLFAVVCVALAYRHGHADGRIAEHARSYRDGYSHGYAKGWDHGAEGRAQCRSHAPLSRRP